MRLQRNHYEILGLPHTATTAEIKRRYRELARKFHPDVVQDKAFGQRAFVQITEAYKTLVDPVQRREYDRMIAPRRPSAGPRSSSTAGRPTSSAHSRHAWSSAGARAADQLIRDAEFAFIRGRLTEAANLCRQAVRQGQSPARAHAILGDVFRVQGRIDQAISEYTLAAQLDPRNTEVANKLSRLLQRERMRQARPSGSRGTYAEEKAVSKIAAINFIGWGVAFFLLLLLAVFPGRPAETFQEYLPIINTWSWNLVLAILIDAILVGALMCATGLIDHPDDELIFEGLGGTKSMAVIPTGLLLLLFAGFFFWGAAALYILVSFFQESLSRSVLRVFAVTTGIVVVSALVYPEGARQIMLFGGNLTFIGMVIGWYIGAVARPIAME